MKVTFLTTACFLIFASTVASANVCESARNSRDAVGTTDVYVAHEQTTVPFNFKAGSLGEAMNLRFSPSLEVVPDALPSSIAICVEIKSSAGTVIANVNMDGTLSSFDLRTDDYGLLYVDSQPIGELSIDSDGRVSGTAVVYLILAPGVQDASEIALSAFLNNANRARQSVDVSIYGVLESDTRASSSAGADRNLYVGDTDFVTVPTSSSSLDRLQTINFHTSSFSVQEGLNMLVGPFSKPGKGIPSDTIATWKVTLKQSSGETIGSGQVEAPIGGLAAFRVSTDETSRSQQIKTGVVQIVMNDEILGTTEVQNGRVVLQAEVERIAEGRNPRTGEVVRIPASTTHAVTSVVLDKATGATQASSNGSWSAYWYNGYVFSGD